MNAIHYLPFLPLLSVVFYMAIILALLYLINKWVNKFISLKHEQNNLLREIIKKLDFKE